MRTARRYAHKGRLGCVSLTRSRMHGVMVGIYRAEQADLCTEGGDWATVCEDHGQICNHLTLRTARWHGPACNWCEDCMYKWHKRQPLGGIWRDVVEEVEEAGRPLTGNT